MALKAARLVSLALTALAFGVAFTHALEMPGKRTLGGPDYLTAQSTLYTGFGNVVGPAEIGALLATLLVLPLVRRRRAVFRATLAGAIGITAALVVWQIFVGPVNEQIDTWTAASLPADWMRLRDRWEYGHAARATLFAAALLALIAAVLADTPPSATTRDAPPPPLRHMAGRQR